MSGEIVHYTEQVAAQLEARFRGTPEQELAAWVRIAQVREAMVSEIYGVGSIDARFGATTAASVAHVARKAIRNIWVHEETHTRYLRALRVSAGSKDALLHEIYGRLQGTMTDAASRGSLFARLAIAVGVRRGQAPAFAAEIKAMNLHEFCQFCGELEETAVLGYRRILALLALLPEQTEPALAYTLEADITKICDDETFHVGVFSAVDSWLEPDGKNFVAMAPSQRVKELHALVDRVFGRDMATVRDPSALADGNAALGWLSDGGIGELFEEYGLPARRLLAVAD